MSKYKKCKACKKEFLTTLPLAQVCSLGCAIEYAQKQRAKKDRKEYREAKVKAKRRSDWIREAQEIVNRFIRIRDKDLGCISCDKPSTWNGQWHASHYYATSIRPNLRFDPENIHKSCCQCNNYLHGNLRSYRYKLIEKIGIEKVERLDKDISPKKYSIDDLKNIINVYKNKIKMLK